jgi:DNA excision repair protein ERCC-4
VLIMSSRTLVVDLLTKRVPTHLISGFIVCQAHKYVQRCAAQPLEGCSLVTVALGVCVCRVKEASTEAFILRLFRESNKVTLDPRQ